MADEEKKKRVGGLGSSRSLNLIPRRWRISGAIWQADTMSVYCRISTCLCVCVCVCVCYPQQRCRYKPLRQHMGWFFFFLTVCVRSDTVYDCTPCRQHSKCTRGHAYVPAHPHPCLAHPRSRKRKNTFCLLFFFFFFSTANHICSRHQHITLQTCCSEWCCLHLPNVDFPQHVFISLVLWNMQPLPGDCDWHIQALGIGVKHDWLSWGVNILEYFSP